MEFRDYMHMHARIIGRAIASRRIRSLSFRRGIFMANRRGCRHLHRLRNIYVLRSCRPSVSDLSLSICVDICSALHACSLCWYIFMVRYANEAPTHRFDSMHPSIRMSSTSYDGARPPLSRAHIFFRGYGQLQPRCMRIHIRN